MALRPDLEGLRIRMPGTDTIYLIDKGRKRGIPSVAMYNRLFRNWDNVHLDLHLDEIDDGEPFVELTRLMRFGSDPAVFFAEGGDDNNPGALRWIASGAVMDRYQFDGDKIVWWAKNPGGPPPGAIDALTKEGRPD
jgi:hypothetical protein